MLMGRTAADSDSPAAARLLPVFIERRPQKAEQHFAVAVLVAQAVEHVVERELAHASRSEAVGQIGDDVRVVLVDFDKAAHHVLDLLRLAQARRGSLGGRQGFGAAQPVFAEVVEHLVHARVHLLAVVDERGVRLEVAEVLVERAREVQLDRRDGELVFRGEESVHGAHAHAAFRGESANGKRRNAAFFGDFVRVFQKLFFGNDALRHDVRPS